jgi:hypothetical protein
MSPQFARTPNPAPLPAEQRGEILADPDSVGTSPTTW